MSPPHSEWNAQAYHHLSEPQFRWGLKVLDRLSLRGDEYVMDAGCGSGRLTAELLERLPNGRVLAVDNSENMLQQAKATLSRFGPEKVQFKRADLSTLEVDAPVDVIFSTATFHWVLDHDALFKALHAALKQNGRLHAQCGGGDNLARTYGRAERILKEPKYARFLEGFHHPTYFAWPDETKARLSAAGFKDAHAALEEAPTVLPDAEAYRAFLENVILRVPLQKITDPALQKSFLDRMVQAAQSDEPPYSLDYFRLNIEATA